MTEYIQEYLFGLEDVKAKAADKKVLFILTDFKTGQFLEDVNTLGRNKQFTDDLKEAIFISNYKNAKDEAAKCACSLKKVEVKNGTYQIVEWTTKRKLDPKPKKAEPTDFKSKLQSLYDKGNIILDTSQYDLMNLPRGVREKVLQVLQKFHANDVYCLKEDDELLCGIRANTFCVEVGYTEEISKRHKIYLISGNHKGIRKQIMLYQMQY